MAIPAGTKFHGVAAFVETENKGSAKANALRDVYTIEEIAGAGTSDTYTLNATTDGDNVDLNLDAVSGPSSTVQLTAGSGVSITQSGGDDVTITNTLNNVGGIVTLEPEIITVESGGTTNLITTKNIVNIDWINGPGTHNVILPSATSIPYRFLRIVNNGTVDANNKVDIYAPGTETIDGDPFYRINKIYNGIAVWSDGTNWTVIQAKST